MSTEDQLLNAVVDRRERGLPRCSTVGCQAPSSGAVIAWHDEMAADEPVCSACAQSYSNRPAWTPKFYVVVSDRRTATVIHAQRGVES